MASVLQTLFSLSHFRQRYYGIVDPSLHSNYLPVTAKTHWISCKQLLPADCLECQVLKVADGLLSGRYSKPHGEPRQKFYHTPCV